MRVSQFMEMKRDDSVSTSGLQKAIKQINNEIIETSY